jgi:predicted phosphodiesterase
MRVAVIADVHGNLEALEAVLVEIERERPDALVIAGDVVGGPEPAETLERFMRLDSAHFVRGNADREVLEAFDDGRRFDPDEKDIATKAGPWGGERITRDQRDFLASFADRVVLPVAGLGEVLFCHATPTSDEEIFTSLTPESTLQEILAGTDQRVLVCGHTHVQCDRRLGWIRIVNAGSVGMPYQGTRGAFWALLGPGVDLRRTDYDYERAAGRIRAGDYFDAENLAQTILSPPGREETEEFFERAAVGARKQMTR